MIRPSTGMLLLAMMTPVALGSGIYKWTDEQGQIHYGDRPANAGATEVPVQPGPGAQESARARSRLEAQRNMLRAYEQERRLNEEESAHRRAEEAERERRCADARQQLTRYRHARGIYEHDAAGTRRYLSHAERAALEQQTEGAVEHWCR